MARTGGWVRYGDDVASNDPGTDWRTVVRRREPRAILYSAFTQPAIEAGHGGDIKNLYNLYVYFWRWALWKVFEHDSATGPGIVSFISASSYIDGDAFAGMREHLRRVCDEVWIVDLGGEGRGTRKEENVFAIRTPVAIAVCVRYGGPTPDVPARSRYARLAGDRAAKLQRLDEIADFDDFEWDACPDQWQAAFRPAGTGAYFSWPQLIDLMPWQHSGAQMKRTWPIAPDEETLRRRWRELLRTANRQEAFKETRDRKVDRDYAPLLGGERQPRIGELGEEAAPPQIERYAYRSFDRQFVIADARVGDFMRPDLWRAHGDKQLYVSSLLTKPIGIGPALTASSIIPDMDYFSGRGAKDVIPLYRDADATEPNITPGVLQQLSRAFDRAVSPEDFLAYVYAVLAHPGFTERFWAQLENRELRVPLTKNPAFFTEAVRLGERLLWLHTFGQRFDGPERPLGGLERGNARCTRAVPDGSGEYPEEYFWEEGAEGVGTLFVGQGAFAPVSRAIYEFEVSGLKIVQSWVNYRLKRPRHAKRSSPLDEVRPERWTADYTTDLLRLLWVLEATVALYPAQRDLLDRIIEGAANG